MSPHPVFPSSGAPQSCPRPRSSRSEGVIGLPFTGRKPTQEEAAAGLPDPEERREAQPSDAAARGS